MKQVNREPSFSSAGRSVSVVAPVAETVGFNFKNPRCDGVGDASLIFVWATADAARRTDNPTLDTVQTRERMTPPADK